MFAESDKFFYPGILPYLRKRGNKSHDDTHHADHEHAHLPVLRQGRRIPGPFPAAKDVLGRFRGRGTRVSALEMPGLPPDVADKEEGECRP